MLRMPVSTRAAITHRRRQTCYDSEDAFNTPERAAVTLTADAQRQERMEEDRPIASTPDMTVIKAVAA